MLWSVEHAVVLWRLLFKCVGFVYVCVSIFVGHEDDYGIAYVEDSYLWNRMHAIITSPFILRSLLYLATLKLYAEHFMPWDVHASLQLRSHATYENL